jgi:pimeloyl-ACP methyl ester carboxylesterase
MTLEISMDDLRQVMEAAGSERAVLFGLEAGAGVSLLFGASFPERTLGLVLQAPLVYSWNTPDFPWGLSDEDAREWEEIIENHWGTVEFWRFNTAAMNMPSPDDATMRNWAKWSRLCASPQAGARDQRDGAADRPAEASARYPGSDARPPGGG